MYSLSQVKKGLRDPGLVLQEVNRLYFDLSNNSTFYDDGVRIFDMDWDNLIILDACRYDKFAERSGLPGDLTRKESIASMTHEWIRANFTDTRVHDTIYVSANGRFAHQKDEVNAEVFEFVGLWDEEHRYGDRSIAPPEMVTKQALEAHRRHPNKRLLIHYLQPHQPYLGPTGEHFEREQHLHEMMRRNAVSRDMLVQAYNENLDIVLEEVSKLLETLGGQTVVSSDHGELLGEREYPIPIRRYGHPEGIYVEELIEIPWLTYQNGERRKIIAEEPEESVEYDKSELEEHLKHMGYRT